MEETKMTPEEVVEGEVVDTPETLINEDNVDTFKVLNMMSQLDDMKRLAVDIKSSANKFVSGDGSDEFVDRIDSKVAGMTVDDVKKMSDNDLYEIYQEEDGTQSKFVALDDPIKDKELKRDFLILRIETIEAVGNIDSEIANLEASMKEYEEEVNNVTDNFSNINDYLVKYIMDKRDKSDTEEAKVKYDNMLIALEDGLTLDNVKEFYKNPMNRRNLIPNFVMAKKTKVVERKYSDVRKRLQLKTDLFKFGDIEKRYLPEKYHVRNNLFVFSIINMVATWAKNTDNNMNGLFLSQFCVNLKNLVYDKFSNDTEKETFVNAACEILDMVI